VITRWHATVRNARRRTKRLPGGIHPGACLRLELPGGMIRTSAIGGAADLTIKRWDDRREIGGAWYMSGGSRMNSLSLTVSDGVATLAIQRTAVSNAIDITIIRAMH